MTKNTIILENGMTVNKKLNEGFVEEHKCSDYFTFRPVQYEDLNKEATFIWHDEEYCIQTGSWQDFQDTQIFSNTGKQLTKYKCVCTHDIKNSNWITKDDLTYYSVGVECIKTFWDSRVICTMCGIRCKNWKVKKCNDCQKKCKGTKTTYQMIQELANTTILDGKYHGKTIREFAQDGKYVQFLIQNSARKDLIRQYDKMKKLIAQYEMEQLKA